MFIQDLFKIYSRFIQCLFKIYLGIGNMVVMQVTSCELPVESCKLPVASCKLQVASCELLVTLRVAG